MSVFRNQDEVFTHLKKLYIMPEGVTFEEIATEKAVSAGLAQVLARAEAASATKEDRILADNINKRLKTQKTYRAILPNGDEWLSDKSGKFVKLHFTIVPTRDGLECWAISQDSPPQKL